MRRTQLSSIKIYTSVSLKTTTTTTKPKEKHVERCFFRSVNSDLIPKLSITSITIYNLDDLLERPQKQLFNKIENIEFN